MTDAARLLRVLTFVASLLVVPVMVLLSVYVGSRWAERTDDVDARAAFLATAVLWLAALASLGAAASKRTSPWFAASLLLFGLTLAGELVSFVAFTTG